VATGDAVTLTVDPQRRAALSVGHTGCHLAALALNAALAGRWRKQPRVDSLGHPDFDQSAITSSRIEPFGSVDEYRLGRSLRRSGFDAAGLADDLPALTETVTATLDRWAAAAGRSPRVGLPPARRPGPDPLRRDPRALHGRRRPDPGSPDPGRIRVPVDHAHRGRLPDPVMVVTVRQWRRARSQFRVNCRSAVNDRRTLN
jgi:hypothetical protein